MSGRIFLDTNVLIYAATGHEAAPKKYDRARNIIAQGDIGISTQVAGEFAHNVQNKRKMNPPLTTVEAARWIETLFAFPVIEIDRAIIESALLIQRRYQLSYWDSQIVAAAERLGAETLYSEDMSHGQFYGSVRCENPFRAQ